LRLGIGFLSTNKLAQHRKVRQTANATVLNDLRTMAISDLHEPSHVSQKSFRIFTEMNYHLVAYSFSSIRCRAYYKSQLRLARSRGDPPSVEQRARIKKTSLTNRIACVRIVSGQISNSCG
jgi:hypothetical protein